MAKGIKGITVEIGGNTTKLVESLKVVDKEIKGTQKDLKELNKLLKVDPGNTDLLAQKQKALKDAIEATSEKLKQQKTALEQLKSSPQNEQIVKQQEALTREIAKSEQALKGFQQEFKNFGYTTGLTKVNTELEKTQTELKEVNQLLKLDPSNTELLAQKQGILKDAIGATAEKLKLQKSALEQLKNAPQTEETRKQQEALTREIIKTEQELKGLKEEYKTFGHTANLTKVNAELERTQTELKEVNQLLKLDPRNTELLAQKQGILKDAIGATAEKLKLQKSALEQLKNAPQTEETIRKQEALTREIIKTEQELKGLKQEYYNFSSVAGVKLTEIGKSFQDLGGKITSAGRSLRLVSAAVAGVGTVATMKFAEVDKTMTLTNSTMKNTAEEAAFLDKAMQEAAKKSTFGMADAANATLNFARAGLDAREAAAALAPAMNLAAGEGGNLDVVSAGLVATINGFHDSFDKATYYADVFAAACNNSALDINSLSQSMSVAAPTFQAVGWDIQDAALYLGLMANNGIEANVGATSLKTGLARLAKPSEEASGVIKALGINIFNTDGSMKDSVTVLKALHDSFGQLSAQAKLAAASSIFGKQQMSAWLALIGGATEDVGKFNQSLSDCTGTTDKMAEAMMSGFGGSIERLKSGIDVLMTTLGRAVADAITPMIAKCQELVDWFSNLDDNARSNIVTIGLFVAAASPFLIITGQLITAIGTITTALGTLYTFLTAKLLPFIGILVKTLGWPIAVIGSIIVIVYKLIDAIYGAGTAAKLISGIWQGACEFMKFCIQGVVDFVKGCIDIIVGAWNWVKENIFGIATETASAVEEMENKVENTVSNTATEIKNGQQHLRQDLRTTNAEIRSDTVLQWQETEQAVTSSSDNMSQKVMDALDKTKKSAKGSNKEITNLISSTKRTLLLENQNIAYNFSEIAQNLGNTLTTSVKDFDEYLGEFTSQGWEATEVYEEITKTISRLFYETGGDLQKVFDTLTGTVKDSTGKCWYMTEEMAKKSMKSVLSGMVEQQEKVLASNKEFGGKLKNELDTHTKQIQESMKKTLDFDWVAAFAKVKERGINQYTATVEEMSSLVEVLKDTLVKNNGDIAMSVKQLGEEYGVQESYARKMFAVLDKETNIFLKISKNASKSLVEDVKTINQQTLQQWQQNKNQTNSILTGLTGNVQNTFKQTRDTAINTTAEIRNSQAQQWGAIQTQTNSALKGISGGASNNFDNIKRQNLEMANYINTAWRNIQKNINESLHAIYSNVNTTFTNIKSSLQRAIIELKGLFNFEWSLPRIKVPHFKLEGQFDVEAGTVPRISVEWYKKAMNDAYILQSPTIFGMAGGKLLGGGEAGSEAVVGTEKLADLIKTAVASVSGGSTVIPVYIGQERIEEIVVRANQNVNYRSGGR